MQNFTNKLKFSTANAFKSAKKAMSLETEAIDTLESRQMLTNEHVKSLIEQQGLLHTIIETVHPEDITDRHLQDMFRVARIILLQIDSILTADVKASSIKGLPNNDD